MNIPYIFKKCTKCEEWLVANNVNFNKAKKGKYGLRGSCKKCRAEHSKQYYERNKKAIVEYNKQYREINKELIVERNKQYYQENKESIIKRNKQYYEINKEAKAECMKLYYEQNKETIAEHNKQYRQSPQGQVVEFNRHNKRRTKEHTQGNGITKEQWLECMEFFDWKCAYSGEYLGGKDNQSIRTIDHIIPLNGGGANEIWNLVPMYKPYNSSKHTKDMIMWYKEQPYYSEERLNKIYEWQEYAYDKWNNNED